MEELTLQNHFEISVIPEKGSIRRRSSRYESKKSSSKNSFGKKKKQKEVEVGIRSSV